jgi:hypothetical protein
MGIVWSTQRINDPKYEKNSAVGNFLPNADALMVKKFPMLL